MHISQVQTASLLFVSLSGAKEKALPPIFAAQKRRLIAGHEDQVKKSWDRLLCTLRDEVDIQAAPSRFQDELRKRGVAVVRGVIPEGEARAYKEEFEAYMRARLHPHMLQTQKFLMSFWHSPAEDALISPIHPLTYADRLRIRQPGDAGFALGPHVDGGSVERWEDNGYGLGQVYQCIWEGRWEEYDPWEAGCRVPAVVDLYNGAGACSMFRMFQGWLGMSHTGPREGTLLVKPLLSMATAYYLLRPFFEPIAPAPAGNCSRLAMDTYLDPTNWRLEASLSSKMEGDTPGYSQDLTDIWHPHLRLDQTMVHIPRIAPGDYVAWHCDTIHSVDKVHQGRGESSVLYIPACPITEDNAQYVRRQREDFSNGVPPPDFPGVVGESGHIGRTTKDDLTRLTHELGLRSLGLEKWDLEEKNLKPDNGLC
ncbi:DUF1479 domain-containing protein [Aspergillus homomorphus CBS 101889]|uniref:DUF1479-domain-containing protein n=1 Tax=Aspergillus homomorphus (strain CBS 101889) TaxID=1450537 RepID=A0A395I1X0_ASPHC|nr:DUF1479-domain-containing protein [Aspergillus homomorphus CBS 101889]RAL14192.1 DUF1479-domain-containing protein [Aspergillus homomorphus CBS 101889]